MLAHELGHAVRDTDQGDRGTNDTIRQRLDRVREEHTARGVLQTVELVDEDHDVTLSRDLLERAPHTVRRHVIAEQARQRATRFLRTARESDLLGRRVETKLVECLAPNTAVVVADVACRTRDEDVRALEHLGGDRSEGRLSDPAFAEDDCMLPWLRGDGEELADLLASAREEAATVDRSGRTKRLAHEPEAVENLRFLDPRTVSFSSVWVGR